MALSTLNIQQNPSAVSTGAPRTTERLPGPASLPIVLFPARMFLALGWIRAGVEKVIDPTWWTGESLQTFLDDQSGLMLPFLEPVAAWLPQPGAAAIAAIVLVAELAIGVCFLSGRALNRALLASCVLAASFVAFGAVAPAAFYLVIQLTLLVGNYFVRPERSAAVRRWTIGALAAGALALAPFISTLHPLVRCWRCRVPLHCGLSGRRVRTRNSRTHDARSPSSGVQTWVSRR